MRSLAEVNDLILNLTPITQENYSNYEKQPCQGAPAKGVPQNNTAPHGLWPGGDNLPAGDTAAGPMAGGLRLCTGQYHTGDHGA
ncbi:hypothetical protein [Niabella beijingensis]|uniref:hypothetical protein n=1 Tax=Niabella beijingensis TaxID=2872700 RepID=UPI001CBBD4B6|nr:hypothetical protein [Niabella beijingensis]